MAFNALDHQKNVSGYHKETCSDMNKTLDNILENALPGDIYLVPFELGAQGQIYSRMGDHASNGSDVMVISRLHPNKLAEYGLNGNAKHIWLTTSMIPGENRALCLDNFLFNTIPLIENFVAARPANKKSSVVLLMDLEVLLYNKISTDSALQLFRNLKNKGGVVIVPVDTIALGPENWKILQRNLEDYTNLMEKPNYAHFAVK